MGKCEKSSGVRTRRYRVSFRGAAGTSLLQSVILCMVGVFL